MSLVLVVRGCVDGTWKLAGSLQCSVSGHSGMDGTNAAESNVKLVPYREDD